MTAAKRKDPLANSVISINIEEYNAVLAENTALKQELENLRKECISTLHAGISYFKTHEDSKKASIESYNRSTMTLEEINNCLQALRDIPQDKRISGIQ